VRLWLRTSLTLGRDRRRRFSKTARTRRLPGRLPRAHRRQLDAMGRDDRPMPRAVARRRLADDLPEHAAESAQAGEAHVEADVGDAAVRLAEEEHRALDAPPLQVAVRRLPEDGAEAAAEMRLGDVRHGGHGADIERLGVGAVHGVASAKEAPVHVLDLPAHRATLYHPRMDSLLIILIV